jgi:diguanylate cyclase (GGDEF)-like protein/PAS domain S-box-containing protein
VYASTDLARESRSRPWYERAVTGMRFSIATQVHAAFAALLLTVLALGGLYIGRLATMNAEAIDTRDDWLPSARALGELRTSVRQYRVDEAAMLLARNEQEFASSRAHLAQAAAAVRLSRAQCEATITPGTLDVRNMKDFDRAWSAFERSSARVADSAAVTGSAEAHRLYFDADQQNYQAALTAVTRNIVFNTSEGIEAENRAIHTYGLTQRMVLGTFLLALLMSVGLGVLLSRSIARPVELMTRTMQRLAAHDYRMEIPATKRRDELGAMAVALDEFRRRLMERDRLQATEYAQRKELEASEARLRTIFESVTEGIFLSDPATGRFLEVNPAACGMTGYARAELLGRDIMSVSSGVAPYNHESVIDWIRKARTEGPQTFEWHTKTKEGRLYWTEVSIRVTRYGERDVVLATLRDIDERKQAEEQLRRLARYDVLTGLPNRAVFTEAVSQAVARSRRGARPFAVLFLDLDRFKDVNDTLGHPTGDELLRVVAARLRGAARDSDVVARFGGDEFAVLAAEIQGPGDAAALADKLIKALELPITIQRHDIRIGTSIGIAMCAPRACDVETLMSHADVALYRAKAEGRGEYRFFTEAMDAETRARVTLIAELRTALASQQFFVLYQPQVHIPTGTITGVEALVRWRHPTRGALGPDTFIHEAEDSGLIVPLGQMVLRAACRQARSWQEAGILPTSVAVNLSAVELRASSDVEREVLAALAESGVAAERLEIELTESVLLQLGEHHHALGRLRERGVRLAIDDFGTGYSSLDYLRRFPADRVKIAQTFTRQLSQPRNAAVVKAAISLAHELGMTVIAEGIETCEQVELLQRWGCAEAQGFYFAQPMLPEELEPLLRAGVIPRRALSNPAAA